MSTTMQGKLQKSLDRFKERISKGSYYEAQQTIRAITNRYVNSKNYDMGIELLYQSSLILMEFKKFDEAYDLIQYLIEIIEQSQGADETKKSQADIKREYVSKIINLIQVIPDSDLNMMNLTKDLVRWSLKMTGDSVGYRNLNFVLGEKMLYHGGSQDTTEDDENLESLGLAELLLLLSYDEKNSLDLLVDLEFALYLKDDDKLSVGYYVSRLVLPYLILGNIKYAVESFSLLVSKFSETGVLKSKGLTIAENGIIETDNESLKLINFLSLLISVVKRSEPSNFNNFKILVNRYKPSLSKYDLVLLVNQISIKYFDAQIIEKQSNLLQDMMSGFLGKK